MRALIIAILALGACKSESKTDVWQPVPANRSIKLHSVALEAFCKNQERTPGWTCDDFANCETVTDGNARGEPSAQCHAKLAPGMMR